MKTAILYTRTRAIPQYDLMGHSNLEGQQIQLKAYCQQYEITILESFADDQHGANDQNRPGLQSLLQFMQEHSPWIDLLLVTSWDRLSRSVVDSITLHQQCHELGIEIVTTAQPGPVFQIGFFDSPTLIPNPTKS